MAQKTSKPSSSVLIEKASTLKRVLSFIRTKTREDKLIALDCEGVDLSRKGKLTILTLKLAKSKVFIFDILKLGNTMFNDGLRELLEDKSIEKLMFDCRSDSDSLWHQYNVKLTGVLDLQLLEVMYRRDKEPSPTTKRYSKRSKNVDDVENVYGYKKCLELYVKDEKLTKAKSAGTELMSASENIWERRPLTKTLIRYCCVDVMGMFKLYESLKEEDRYLGRLRVASERYLERYRCLEEREYDDFECNAYLPLDIIPDEGRLSFDQGTTKCVECTRLFPHEEFSFNQLSKGIQKCRVCKKIKRLLDVQENREDNWRRAEEAENNYLAGISWMYDSDEAPGFFF